MFQKLFNHFYSKSKPSNSDKFSGLEVAFECGGKRFYKWVDERDIPVERFLAGLDVYEELEFRMTREYLDSLFTTVVELANKGRLVQIANLITEAQKRLEHVAHAPLMYKLASVLYVAEDEDLYKYSLQYAGQKIQFWQEHEEDVNAFFLRLPIKDLIPLKDSSPIDLKKYSKAQAENESRVLNYHLSLLSEASKSEDLKNTLLTLMSQNEAFKRFLNSE